MFVGSLPSDVKKNAKTLNGSKTLFLPDDQNANTAILKRMRLVGKVRLGYEDKETRKWMKKKNRKGLFYELGNIIVNIWCALLINFQLTFFNYFGGIICICLQIGGFYFNMYQ